MNTSMTITGRIGQEPTLAFSQSGMAYLRLSVATEKSKKVKGEWENETIWLDVTVFGELAEHSAETLSKGDLVIAHGQIEAPRAYEKKDGTTGASLGFLADELGASLRFKSYTGMAEGPRAKIQPVKDHSEEPF